MEALSNELEVEYFERTWSFGLRKVISTYMWL